jgi:hypothetical protein
MYGEIFNFEKHLPSIHPDSPWKYLQTSNRLIPDGEELIRPVIRNPDLRPSNILVSDDYEITSMIDWQHAVVLSLFLQCGVPGLDESIDLASDSLESPRLPDDLSVMDEDSRLEQLELSHKRQLRPISTGETSKSNPKHCDALTLPFPVGRRKIYDLSCAPWQGENTPL